MRQSRAQAPTTRLGFAFAWVLIAVGFLARVIPLFPTDRLLQQFPTEDGYMMLTVSRNIGLGLGMSTAGGTLPTNGVQPLATYLYTLGYVLFGGDKTAGVAVALFLQLVIACIAAWLLYVLGRRVCGDDERGKLVAAIAAALWFAGPRQVAHSMNCLESGLYALFVIWGTLIFWDGARAAPWNWKQCIGVGAVLGGVFLARNDGVFFILSACLWYVYAGRRDGVPGMRARLGRTLLFGSTSVLVALPWLVSNHARFGHIVPISGQSESLGAKFGENLALMPAAVWEALVPLLPVPLAMERLPVMIAVVSVTLVVLLAIAARAFPRLTPERQALLLHTLFYSLCLTGFYGLYFGAAHFVARYLFPASSLLCLWGTMLVFHLLGEWNLRRGLIGAAATIVVVMIVGVHVRAYAVAIPHQHWSVVSWVRGNTSENTWVSAVQTGTLGYYHDRTLNLDGKVNPLALEARKRGGAALREYPIGDERIEYLVDWHGVRDWYDDHAVLREHFDLVVADPEASLFVMRRRERASGDATANEKALESMK